MGEGRDGFVVVGVAGSFQGGMGGLTAVAVMAPLPLEKLKFWIPKLPKVGPRQLGRKLGPEQTFAFRPLSGRGHTAYLPVATEKCVAPEINIGHEGLGQLPSSQHHDSQERNHSCQKSKVKRPYPDRLSFESGM